MCFFHPNFSRDIGIKVPATEHRFIYPKTTITATYVTLYRETALFSSLPGLDGRGGGKAGYTF
jgi:hypothetical protein